MLIRALEPRWGIERDATPARPRAARATSARGPGKLTEALGIELAMNRRRLHRAAVRAARAARPRMAARSRSSPGPGSGSRRPSSCPWRFCAAGSDVPLARRGLAAGSGAPAATPPVALDAAARRRGRRARRRPAPPAPAPPRAGAASVGRARPAPAPARGGGGTSARRLASSASSTRPCARPAASSQAFTTSAKIRAGIVPPSTGCAAELGLHRRVTESAWPTQTATVISSVAPQNQASPLFSVVPVLPQVGSPVAAFSPVPDVDDRLEDPGRGVRDLGSIDLACR